MAAKDAVVVLSGTSFTKISDGNISTAQVLQNLSQRGCLIAFSDNAAQPADSDPAMVWEGGATEPDFSIPGGPLAVWGRPLPGGPDVRFYVKHA